MGVKEKKPYVRFTLTEAVNMEDYADDRGVLAGLLSILRRRAINVKTPADDGGSGVQNYKVIKIKYIDMPLTNLVSEEYLEKNLEDLRKKLKCLNEQEEIQEEIQEKLKALEDPKVMEEELAEKKVRKLLSKGLPKIAREEYGPGSFVVIPPTNIASADVRLKYPSKRSQVWHEHKEKGKTFIKVFGIILGFVLAITQIAINIITLSSF